MPVADELYLLYQQSKDLYVCIVNKWEEHFQWLQEVRDQAKESRGQTIIPKTPVRKRKIKKENEENLPPPPPKDIEETELRKSSRAAAKTAKERNKKTLKEISNLNSKLRRPSTPKKESLCNKSQENERTVQNKEITTETSSSEVNNLQFSKVNEESTDIVSAVQGESKVSEFSTEERKLSKGIKSDLGESEGKVRCTRLSNPLKPKKRSIEEHEHREPIVRVTRSKRRKLSEEAVCSAKYKPSVKVPQLISKEGDEESLHLHMTANESDDNPNDLCHNQNKTASPVLNKCHGPVIKPPNRITRSKVRQIITSSLSEQGLKHENLTNTVTGIDTAASDSCSDVNKVESDTSKHVANAVETSSRITRSKVCQITTQSSCEQQVEHQQLTNAAKLKMNKEYHTPKGKTNSPMPTAKSSASPGSGNPNLKTRKKLKATFEIQEVSIDSIDASSSPRKVVKHTRNEKKAVNVFPRKGKLPYQTPSPISSAIKILDNKGVYISGSHTSSYSQKRGPFLNSSPQVIGVKIIGTPTEVNKTRNIVSGTSFLTKVQPSRPTREESEERKQDELRKKREREEETRRKKEGLLRFRMEEQKRKNEERMRRVQEAREARERKAAEERELQEKERKLREERIKKGKKRNMIAAKKNEEMRQQALRKQMEEEQRLKAEQKLKEQKLKEEQKVREEIKRLEQKREEERIAREAKERLEQERLREAERITREKMEMEQLKLKKAERKASPKKLNETYTADTKGRQPPSVQTLDPKQSYAITPVEKPQLQKKKNFNDYGIADLRSDDSTDEECAPKKEIPLWAKSSQLRKQLFDQEHYPPNCDAIFPADVLLKMPDLVQIFPKRERSRFTKRTSSAVWSTPPSRVFAPSNR